MAKTPINQRPRQDAAAHLPRVEVGGRFLTQYNPDKALEILEKLAEGETLNKICLGVPDMPAPKTFRRWMVNNPNLAKAYQAAILASATSFEEEALDSARALALSPKDGTTVRAVEVKLNQLRWSAERRDPAKFGTKSQINIKVPVHITTPLDLNMSAGGNDIQDIYTIQAKALKSPDEAALEAKGSEPLVPERPLRPGDRGKLRLTPPGGQKMNTPFSKLMRGLDDSRKSVRKEGSGEGDRKEHEGPRDGRLPGAADQGKAEGQDPKPGSDPGKDGNEGN